MPADADAEARIHAWASTARLSHPHLMRIFDTGRAQVGSAELLYVVTEYAEESLAQVIPERPLSTREAREMLGPILEALAYLHAQGIVYGRIKPSNIMVVGDRLKLPIDTIQPAGELGKTSAPARPYDAPETGSGAISPAADAWSLGITLVEALTQQLPPWVRSEGQDPVVSTEISQPFADIARGCLRSDPAKRASLREIRSLLNPPRSLQEPANEIDQVAPAEIGARPAAVSHASPDRRRVAAIAAGAVILLALIAFFFMRSRPSEPSQPTVAQPTAPAVTRAPAPSPVAPSPPPSSGTAKGAIAERVLPDTLAKANRTIHGKVEVTIRLKVDANGAVSNARIESPGHSRYFADKALQAARRWRFTPAKVNGQPVASEWVLRFDFRPAGPEVNARELSPQKM
jgi:TonB family protein